VRSFVLGEGIVKKEADLAAEVEEQTKSFEKAAAEKAAASVDAPAAEVAAEADDAADAKPAVQVGLPDPAPMPAVESRMRHVLLHRFR
jgi:hypothetical protein